MSANTILLDFSIHPANISEFGPQVESEVIDELEKHWGNGSLQSLIARKEIPSGGSLAVFLGPRGSVITVRFYSDKGLVTITIEYYLEEKDQPLLSLESMKEMELSLGGRDDVVRVKTFPPIRRGANIDVYMTTTDERLLEYDIDAVLYDEASAFQHIQILHSTTFGNLLVLDDLQNLAESDLIYTESIMCRGVENYKGKDILILGGGDGALLYELRKESAKSITMVEIDEMVMKACRVHLRSACGDTLDDYKKDNYEIIVGDCVNYMKKCIEDRKHFDYVFADLTDIPISQTPQGEMWDFVLKILDLSFKILKDGGKYMTHGNGSASPGALKMFEDVLGKLGTKVEFKRTNAFVPSFMEDWVFYQIQRKKTS